MSYDSVLTLPYEISLLCYTWKIIHELAPLATHHWVELGDDRIFLRCPWDMFDVRTQMIKISLPALLACAWFHLSCNAGPKDVVIIYKLYHTYRMIWCTMATYQYPYSPYCSTNFCSISSSSIVQVFFRRMVYLLLLFISLSLA